MEEEKIDVALKTAKENGIRNIVALRGGEPIVRRQRLIGLMIWCTTDPPAGQEEWTATEGGFTCALDLVKYIRKEYDDFFCIAVSGTCLKGVFNSILCYDNDCAIIAKMVVGYPEGHPNAIKKVENEDTLTDAEKVLGEPSTGPSCFAL